MTSNDILIYMMIIFFHTKMYLNTILENGMYRTPNLLSGYLNNEIANKVIESMNKNYELLLSEHKVKLGVPRVMVILKYIIFDTFPKYYILYLRMIASDQSILLMSSDIDYFRFYYEIEKLTIRSYRRNELYTYDDFSITSTNIVTNAKYSQYVNKCAEMALNNYNDDFLKLVLKNADKEDSYYCSAAITHVNHVLYDWLINCTEGLDKVRSIIGFIAYSRYNTTIPKIIEMLSKYVSSDILGKFIIELHNLHNYELFILFTKICCNINYPYLLSLNPNFRIREAIDEITSQV